SFSDVPADAWYAGAVNALASIEVIAGVGNSRFDPMRPLTRAEFTVMAMRFAKLDTDGENIFSDITEDDWFFDYIVGSVKYGWISGYTDGTFRPNEAITRAEVTVIVNRMLGRAADEDYVDDHADSMHPFSDLTDSSWAYYQIMEATNAHDYTKSHGAETWTKLRQ
ncbi:S-layer homology domain-containing protein, partial [Bacteroides thetaiotaomicron]